MFLNDSQNPCSNIKFPCLPKYHERTKTLLHDQTVLFKSLRTWFLLLLHRERWTSDIIQFTLQLFKKNEGMILE